MSTRISFSKKEILVILLCIPLILSVGFGLIAGLVFLLGGEDAKEIFQQKIGISSPSSETDDFKDSQRNFDEQSSSTIGSGRKFKSSASLSQAGWVLEKARKVKGVKDVELMGTSWLSQFPENNPPEGCDFWGHTLYTLKVSWKFASYKTDEIICVAKNDSLSFGKPPRFTHIFRGR